MSKSVELENELELAELHGKFRGSEGKKESIQMIKKQEATIDK
jgi:hypothetical protein